MTTLATLSLGEKGRMIKSELVQRIAEQNPHLFATDADRILNTIFDEIATALARRDRVELRGFGAFIVKTRSARQGRNPKTGAIATVPEKRYPRSERAKRYAIGLTASPQAPCAPIPQAERCRPDSAPTEAGVVGASKADRLSFF